MSIYPEPRTHIEPVRYGDRSNRTGLLRALLIDGPTPADGRPRWRKFLGRAARHPLQVAQMLNQFRSAGRCAPALGTAHPTPPGSPPLTRPSA